MEKLQHLLNEGIIDEVFQQLKTGKEAEVWLVSHRGEPVAAKLYKEREFRSFKNDSGYLEGRQVRNTRTQRAMNKGTSYGKKAAEDAWKSAEADAMYALHAAGVRVPKPVLFYDGVLLMEVIGDHEGRVAPRLVEAAISPEQVLPLYLQLRGEVVKMLCADLIHGDLSEFNVLLGVDGPVIIDFPQVVAAARNSNSERFFRRDLGNLVRFFSALNPEVQKHAGDADEIWRAYTRRELSVGYVPTGRGVAQPNRQPQGQDKRRGPFRHGAPRGPNEQRGGAPQSSTGPNENERRRGPPNGAPRGNARDTANPASGQRGPTNQLDAARGGQRGGAQPGRGQPEGARGGNPNVRDGQRGGAARGPDSTRGGNPNARDGQRDGTRGPDSTRGGNPNVRGGQSSGAARGPDGARGGNPNVRDGQRGGAGRGPDGARGFGQNVGPNTNEQISGAQRRGPEVSFKGPASRASRPQQPRPSSNRRR